MKENNWIDAVKEHVHHYLEVHAPDYFPEVSRDGHSWRVIFIRYHTHLFSVILEYEIQNASFLKKVFVKLRRGDKTLPFLESTQIPEAQQFALREFEFHRNSYSFFERMKTKFHAVRPLDYDKNINALIVEGAPGIELGTWLSKNDFGNDDKLLRQAHYYFETIGTMARLFHEENVAERKEIFNPTKEMKNFRNQINKLTDKNIEIPYLKKLESRLGLTLERFNGVEYKIGKIHGDFKPQHIFVHDDDLYLIDFGNDLGWDTPYIDVAAFYLEILSMSFASFRKKYFQHYTQFLDIFLNAYGEGREMPWIFQIKVIYYLLKKWNRRIKRFSHNPLLRNVEALSKQFRLIGLIHHQYTNPWFIQNIEKHLKRLEQYDSVEQSRVIG